MLAEHKHPRISVVITAFDRREFVLTALRSALNQSLSRDLYEIVLVKNFDDIHVDAEATSGNVTLVHCDEKAIGAMALVGIRASSGEVVSFLDDDDAFVHDKLETVSKVMTDESIGYYHNSVVLVSADPASVRPFRQKQVSAPALVKLNETNESGLLNLIDDGASFNSSSVSVRRDILKGREQLLRNTYLGPGFTLFIISLLSSKANFLDTRRLTKYRVPQLSGDLIVQKSKWNIKALGSLRLLVSEARGEILTSIVAYKSNELFVRSFLFNQVPGGLKARRTACRLLGVSKKYRPIYRAAMVLLVFLWPVLAPPIRRILLRSPLF